MAEAPELSINRPTGRTLLNAIFLRCRRPRRDDRWVLVPDRKAVRLNLKPHERYAVTDDITDPVARRREQWRQASRRRREKRKIEGLSPESGPSGKSGGAATNADRQRRHRERKKKERQDQE